MSLIKSNRNESVVDLVIRSYGHVEGIIDFIRDNGLAIDDVETTVVERLVNDVRKQELRNERVLMPVRFLPTKAEVKISRGQNNVDLALQELGSVEGLISLLRNNQVAATVNIAPGTIVKTIVADIVNADVTQFYKALNYQVNTDTTEVDVIVPTGIGSMIIETNFIVG